MKAHLKNFFLTRPFYKVLYYLWHYGAKTTLFKIRLHLRYKKKTETVTSIAVIDEEKSEIQQNIPKKYEKGSNKFYVNDCTKWNELLENDWCSLEMQYTKVVKNGIVLPMKPLPDSVYGSAGGVCDAKGSFIAGHIREKTQTENQKAYLLSEEPEYIPETVVFGGIYIDHYGHIITECLSRLWWFVENADCGYKCVFISSFNRIGTQFIELLALLGIPEENIILCQKPTRFDTIIIPDQASVLTAGYNAKAKTIYNAIRDSVKPAQHKKVYLTRTKLPINDIINEEYFENYYSTQGFQIISPELLSVKEQVEIMSSVQQLVCTEGTLGHQVAFCQDGVQVTILNKQDLIPNLAQVWLNLLRNVKCTYIDVSFNFLPVFCHASGCLLIPTDYWMRYISDNSDTLSPCEDVNIDRFTSEYLKMWAKKAVVFAYRPDQLKIMQSYSLADVIIDIHEKLLCEKLDESVKKYLHEALT